MTETEQIDSDALPLAAAAARLGISSDALRMRINRGKIRGFKRGGRLFAVLEEAPTQAPRTARAGTEQTAPGRSEQARDRSASVRSPGEGPSRGESSRRPAAPEPGEASLPLVVEFQKVELSRLLRDNSRLNQRLDQFMDEMRHLREMQQREQVLRQQDQALRQRTQALIERLTAAPASVSPRSGPSGPGAVAPKNVPTARDAGPAVSAVGSESAAPADVLGESAAKAEGVSEPVDLASKNSTYAYGEDAAAPAPPAAPPPGVPTEAPPGPPNEPGESWRGAHRDGAELADLLKDIGASLRARDSTAAGAPGTAEPDPTVRRAPPPVPAARRMPSDLAGPPVDDEASLLEILGRMGPSAEERRTAARLMKRLFKGRAARRRGEPGDDAD